jgi:glycogen(starch) synthase
MNILQLTSDFPPNPLWGMGWHVYFLTNRLRELKHSVKVGTANKGRDVNKDLITTSKTQDHALLSDNRYEIFNDYNKYNLWQILLADEIISRDYKFDVIHNHNWMSWLTTKKVKANNHNAKVITSFHFLQKQYDSMIENPIPTYHEQIIELEQEALDKSDYIIVFSESQLELLERLYSVKDTDNIFVIPHGIDFKKIDYNLITSKKEENKHLDIVFVGRIESDKGVEETIQAFLNISRFNSRLRLNIIGDGSLLENLRVKYKKDRIIFYGYIDRNKLQYFLINSIIICLPSLSETFGMSILEAMHFGVVPIFSAGPSVPYLFDDGIQGLKTRLSLVNGTFTSSVADITNKLKYLIDNKSLRHEMSLAAYNLATTQFSLEKMTNQIINLYLKQK